MLGQYNQIDKVVCEDGYETFFITDGNESYEVDVKSDFWFNELKVLKRETLMKISSLSEVFAFLKKQNIDYSSRLDYGNLKVGGEADMIVNEDLEYYWE